MLVLIDGWWGSGKSVLRGLLDGHSELFVSPLQESLLGGLSQVRDIESTLNVRDLVEIRKQIAHLSEFYRLERDARNGHVVGMPSGGEQINGKFTFDFYAFEKRFVDSLTGCDELTVDLLTAKFYDAFSHTWEDYSTGRNLRKFVTLENNFPNTGKFILDTTEHTKFIWVDRQPASILASMQKRQPVKGRAGTSNWGRKKLHSQLGQLRSLEKKRMYIENLAKHQPNRIMVVPFEGLLNDTSVLMREVAEFLEISDEKILHEYTYCGQTFEGAEKYTAKENDKAEDIFSPSDMREISRVMGSVRSNDVCNRMFDARSRLSPYINKILKK